MAVKGEYEETLDSVESAEEDLCCCCCCIYPLPPTHPNPWADPGAPKCPSAKILPPPTNWATFLHATLASLSPGSTLSPLPPSLPKSVVPVKFWTEAEARPAIPVTVTPPGGRVLLKSTTQEQEAQSAESRRRKELAASGWRPDLEHVAPTGVLWGPGPMAPGPGLQVRRAWTQPVASAASVPRAIAPGLRRRGTRCWRGWRRRRPLPSLRRQKLDVADVTVVVLVLLGQNSVDHTDELRLRQRRWRLLLVMVVCNIAREPRVRKHVTRAT